MSSQLLDQTWAITGAGLVTLALWYWSRPSVPLPPGPRGNPIFGSALELRGSKPFWLAFAEYSERYGPLITIRMMFRRVIIISDPKIITELFEKRASQYSDRRVGEMIKLVGWEYDLLFLRYGPLLKHYRTLLQRAFNNRVVVDYLPLQEYEVKRMMRRLSETPEHFMRHIHLMAGSVAIRMAYGYKVNSPDDPLVEGVEKSMVIFADIGTPGRWMVDVFPHLRYFPPWFPGMGFRKAVASWLPMIRQARDEPFEFTKQQIAAGTAEPSFVSKLLDPESGEEVTAEEEAHIKVVASSLYGAASDTTVSAIKSFFLAMLLYPGAQARAQEEITAYLRARAEDPDAKPGLENTTQFITMADKPSLPYTSALVRELLRWHPIIPIVGHQSADEDDNNVICDGKTYRIPAHTPVIVNAWQIMHDAEVYAQPDKFMPERFLVNNPPPHPETYAFGFGRRICPGMHAAQQSMWLSISNILSAFTITKAKDENGEEIVPEERYTSDIISHPMPFKCNIRPREGCREWLMTFDD